MSKYDILLDTNNLRDPVVFILENIQEYTEVLEFGSASGRLTKYLKEEKCCNIDIVEIDYNSGQNAAAYARRSFIGDKEGDIEKFYWRQNLSAEKYDYIIFADVLEHLRDPEKVLEECRTLLKDSGSIFISVPNIAHNSIILSLLKDDFQYTETGLLDETHIYFFTYKSILRFFQKLNYSVVQQKVINCNVGENEINTSYSLMDKDVVRFLKKRENGTAYQFVFQIKKGNNAFPPLIPGTLPKADYCFKCFIQKKGKSTYETVLRDVQGGQNTVYIQKSKFELASKIFVEPFNENCIIRIDDIFTTRDQKRVELSFRVLNGFQMFEKTYLFSEVPQIEIVGVEELEDFRFEYTIILYESTILEQIYPLIKQMEEKFMEEKTKRIEEQNEIIEEKTKKIEAIYGSRGWTLVRQLWKIRDVILPLHSKRRLFLKLSYKTIKHPSRMLSNLKYYQVKKFLYYLKTEGVQGANRRLNHYIPENSQVEITYCEPEIVSEVGDYKKISFDISGNPLVSIIIPVYNQFSYTYYCLQSIRNNTSGIDYEIIIADDCSSDHTVDILGVVQGIKVIRSEKNLQFLSNCNNASKHARGKYILFLNNDTQVQNNWLNALVELLEKYEDIGMVGSKLVYPDGRLQEAGGIVWNDASAWNYGRLDDPGNMEYNYVKDVDYISGASILLRKELWQDIGGFDSRYAPAYYEDTDLAFEIRTHGYRVVYQPLSVVVHFEGISNGTELSQGTKQYQKVNREKFFDKWKSVLKSDHFPNAEKVFFARDRSRDRKTILIIDHYVPHYDCDAGGRCTFYYLKLFVQMGMHVIFVGDNYFKHEPYATVLNQMGIEVFYGNWNIGKFEKWLNLNGSYIDYAYLNRPHISEKYMDMVRQKTKAKIIYFGHDLHFLREKRQYEIEKNEQLLVSSKESKEKEMVLFNKADVIHVVGEYELKVLNSLLPDKLIRNIPLYLYEKQQLDELPQATTDKRNKLIFVGGFNHKPNEDAVIWFINEIYPLIKAALPKILFYIIGSNPSEKIYSLTSDDIITTGYVDDKKLELLYSEARVAVVPLRYGAGIKGKIIEAMYYRVPIVTTSIGAEGLGNVEESIFVCENPKDYAEAVIELFKNDNIWNEKSVQALNYIKNNFTTDRAKEILSLDIKL